MRDVDRVGLELALVLGHAGGRVARALAARIRARSWRPGASSKWLARIRSIGPGAGDPRVVGDFAPELARSHVGEELRDVALGERGRPGPRRATSAASRTPRAGGRRRERLLALERNATLKNAGGFGAAPAPPGWVALGGCLGQQVAPVRRVPQADAHQRAGRCRARDSSRVCGTSTSICRRSEVDRTVGAGRRRGLPLRRVHERRPRASSRTGGRSGTGRRGRSTLAPSGNGNTCPGVPPIAIENAISDGFWSVFSVIRKAVVVRERLDAELDQVGGVVVVARDRSGRCRSRWAWRTGRRRRAVVGVGDLVGAVIVVQPVLVEELAARGKRWRRRRGSARRARPRRWSAAARPPAAGRGSRARGPGPDPSRATSSPSARGGPEAYGPCGACASASGVPARRGRPARPPARARQKAPTRRP